ncbi:helix-turn-helix domain-containing protein [Amycolatopsis japonica]
MTTGNWQQPTDQTVRRDLGELLTEARKKAGKRQVDIERLIKKSQSTVTKIEHGTTSISQEDLGLWITACKVDDEVAERMRELWHRANAPQRVWSGHRIGTPEWFVKVLTREARADEVCSWTGERIPGLLQSVAYMYDQFGGSGLSMEVSPRFDQRKKRQELFNHPEKRFTFVISQAALDRLCAQRDDIVEDQLGHMLTLTDRPNINIRYVSHRAASYVDPDFIIFRYPDKGKDTGYSENIAGVAWSTRRSIKSYNEAWAALLDIADSAEDTRAELHRRYRLAKQGDHNRG